MKHIDYFKRNIKLIKFTGSMSWGRFIIPILALFYIAHNVSLKEFTIIFGVFSFAMLLFEIPSGAVADLLGKKKVMILANILYLIEFLIFIFYDGFKPFLIGKIISGIGVSLASGSRESLLYDTLKKMKKEKDYKLHYGDIINYGQYMLAFVSIVGPILFSINIKYPVYASIPFTIAVIIGLCFLTEVETNSKTMSIKNTLLQIKEGLKYSFSKEKIKYLLLYAFSTGFIFSTILNLSSKYYENILIPIAYIGIISAVFNIISGYGGKKAHFIEQKLGTKKSLIIPLVILIVALLLFSMQLPYYGILFMFIIAFTMGFMRILTSDYINKEIPSSHRATIISIKNMFSGISTAILFPIIGKIIEVKNFSFGINFAVIVLTILSIFIINKTIKIKVRKKY